MFTYLFLFFSKYAPNNVFLFFFSVWPVRFYSARFCLCHLRHHQGDNCGSHRYQCIDVLQLRRLEPNPISHPEFFRWFDWDRGRSAQSRYLQWLTIPIIISYTVLQVFTQFCLFLLYFKMHMFRRAGMRKGGKPLPLSLAFQYIIKIKYWNGFPPSGI